MTVEATAIASPAQETRSSRIYMVETMRYLAILPPSPTSKEPRHRDVEPTADLAIGDELFLDELAFRVIELIPPPKDNPGAYVGTVVCTPAELC